MSPRKPITKAAIVARMKAVAKRLGRRRITRDEFLRESGISRKAIGRHFARFWDLLRPPGSRNIRPTGRWTTRRCSGPCATAALRCAG